MSIHFAYFHGFASGPDSQKGQILRKQLAKQIDEFICPDLNGDDFLHLTMDTWMQLARKSIAHVGADDVLILSGSSLGAYTAALLSAEMQDRKKISLLLIAPAFGFVNSWTTILGGAEALAQWQLRGSIPFFHYQHDRDEHLGYAFYESCQALPSAPDPTVHPGVIIHGAHDEVVPLDAVKKYAAQNSQMTFIQCDDDHALLREDSQQVIRDQASILLDASR